MLGGVPVLVVLVLFAVQVPIVGRRVLHDLPTDRGLLGEGFLLAGGGGRREVLVALEGL